MGQTSVQLPTEPASAAPGTGALTGLKQEDVGSKQILQSATCQIQSSSRKPYQQPTQRILCLLEELALAVLREFRGTLQASGLPRAYLANQLCSNFEDLRKSTESTAKILQ